ncbi:MAG: Gfo/Idh/MocA family protein, partial [Terriglobales bacterium]
PDVDAVFIASPNSLHLPDAIACLQRGKPVLLEKPMGMNADECRAMIAAAQGAGVKFGVAHIFRFEQSVNRIREIVRSGVLGPVVHARCDFTFPGRGHVRSWLNDASVAGGGPVADIGVHCIDTLRYVLGEEVAEVAAFTTSDDESRDVEATASLNLRFRSGLTANVFVSYRAAYRTPVQVIGEKAEVSAQDGLTVDRPVTIEVKRVEGSVSREVVNNELSYAVQVDAFADWLTDDIPFPAPAEEGLRNQLVLDAAYRSARSGRAETVAEI